MPVSIRDATTADIPTITRIYAHAVRFGTASFELEPPDETEMLARFYALMSSGHPYIVAEGEGTILGYAYAGPFRPRPAYRHSVEDSVYVTPEAHRRGVGRALLDALIARCTDLGFRHVRNIMEQQAINRLLPEMSEGAAQTRPEQFQPVRRDR